MLKKLLKDKASILLILFLLIGVGLRFYGLFTSELYRDEAFSALLAQHSFADIITIATHDSSVPFAFFLQHISGEILGFSVFALRLPSFLFSLSGLFYFWKLINLTNLSKALRYFVFTMFCLNPPLIYNSGEARFYSIFAALFIYQLYLIIKIWQKKQITISDQIKFIITSAIGIYDHSLYWLVIFAWGITGLVFIRQNYFKNKAQIFTGIKKVILPFLIILLTYLPWLQTLIAQYSRGGNGTWLKFNFYNTLVVTLTDFMYWPTGFNINALDLNGACIFILGHLCLLIAGFAIIKNLTEKPPVPSINKYLSVFFTLFMALFFFISVKTPLFYVRYQAFLIPVYLLLLGMGISFFSKKILYFFIILIVGLTVFIQVRAIYPRDNANANLTAVISQIDQSHGSNYLVVNEDALTYFNMEYYGGKVYTSYIFDKYSQTPFWVGKAVIPDDRFIKSIPGGKDQIFVISDSVLDQNILTELDTQQYIKSQEFSYYQGLKLFIYVKKPGA